MNYDKYTKDPALYGKTLDKGLRWGFPDRADHGAFDLPFVGLSRFSIGFGALNSPFFPMLVYVVPFAFIIISLLRRKSPVRMRAPLPVFLSDMFKAEKIDTAPTAPMTDKELFNSVVFGDRTGPDCRHRRRFPCLGRIRGRNRAVLFRDHHFPYQYLIDAAPLFHARHDLFSASDFYFMARRIVHHGRGKHEIQLSGRHRDRGDSRICVHNGSAFFDD